MQVTLSIREVPGLSKDDRAFIKYYSKFISCDFTDLVDMLSKDYMFSPFNYLGYEQGTFNICSEASFVVIDVDSTSISIHERLTNLTNEGIQSIIATTSDPSNLYKYRILIPLDTSLTADEYRAVVTGIMSFGLVSDMDPASAKPAQKFYAYANSLVLSDFTNPPLITSDYMVDISLPEYRATSPTANITEILHEFDSYRFATKGKRTRSLLSVAYTCIELGLSYEQLEQVVNYVNSLFLIPKPQSEVNRRVLNFIKQQRRHT